MSTDLHRALDDYLEVRRALGYKLKDEERFMRGFVEHLHSVAQSIVTADAALAWATGRPGATPEQAARRLTAIRGFAIYLKTLDPDTEVPPRLVRRSLRGTPYLYSEAEIAALLKASEKFSSPLRVATYRTLIGLLVVSGMRVGEAIRADRDDLDLETGVLVIRQGKFGKTRALPLHPSTVTALGEYLELRDRLYRRPKTPALFISSVGKRLIYQNVQMNWLDFVHIAGLQARSATCRPRIHDLRHTFAVNTLLDWYREGVDVRSRMPLLSTYLGHVHPADTYWYLSAAPELLQLAGDRLERHLGETA